jgi:hypothetical protein
MGIFTKQFKQDISELVNSGFSYLENSYSTIWLHVIILACLLIAFYTITPFAIYGIDKWWITYSAINPNVTLGSTLMYFSFNVGINTFRIGIILYGLFVIATIFAWIIKTITEDENESEPVQLQTPATKSIAPLARIQAGTNIIPKSRPINPPAITNPTDQKPLCPVCGSNAHITKNGRKRNGQPRYFCSICKKEI